MEIYSYILFGIILVCLFLIWYTSTFNRFEILLIKINEVENNIDNILRKRYDLLAKAVELLKKDTELENPLELIKNIKSKKYNNFELDRELVTALNEYSLILEDNPSLKSKEAYMKIDIALNESETEIEAFRHYYNDIITENNKLAGSFPTIIVGKIAHYNKRQYFDQKEDKIVKL